MALAPTATAIRASGGRRHPAPSRTSTAPTSASPISDRSAAEMSDEAGEAEPTHEASSPSIDTSTSTSGSYRGLIVTIVVFLALLLAGAVALIIYLAGHTTLP